MHLNPRGRQIFQILQMASTMCIELGMDRAVEAVGSEPESVAHSASNTDPMFLVIRRTYAACCHLSSV